MSKEWLKIEVAHRVSKTASDAFWSFGKKWFHNLFETKTRQRETKKTPDFVHIRRGLYSRFVPEIHMEIAYEHLETGEITVLESSVTPKRQFPSNEYRKIWEMASVEVKLFLFI